MKIINLNDNNTILNQFVSEVRNVEVQNDRLRFRRNLERIGEIMAYEISKTFTYSPKQVTTPLGTATVNTPDTEVVSDGYFHESEMRSAPYFNVSIDGITTLNSAF